MGQFCTAACSHRTAAARLHSRVWPMTTPPALHAAHGHGRPGVTDAHGAHTRVGWCLANEPANRAGWPFVSCKGDGWCGSGVSWTMWLSTGSRDGPDVASTLRSDLHKEGGKVGSMQPKREAGTGPRPAKVRRGHHQRPRRSRMAPPCRHRTRTQRGELREEATVGLELEGAW
jgi:hypothetical protein